ncbi:hypothetical protein BCR39DRAFT_497700 [Naematelia encephala]|uniref:Myo-inositol 2-dehydrogenase n=1 Tax=Naematelia encephala TaxID=71784 RepID=A0A1Y2AWR5_9TREE|nr:hypothetical protein BCR39DRAFT_497700 [Naematelia encephala]
MTACRSPRLRFGVLGCGRMGQRHAYNIAYLTPRAELSAICDPHPEALKWVPDNISSNIRVCTDPEDIFNDAEIDAVVIATVTSTHSSLAIRAIQAGKHVLLEKPISTDIESARPVVEAAEAHPQLKVMIGFCRRFDPSYHEAKDRILSGFVGLPYLVKATTSDLFDNSGFFVNYARHSGGIFNDAAVHDIDISRWLLSVDDTTKLANPRKQVRTVYGTGSVVRHPELAEFGDCDTALGIIAYENGTQCSIHIARTATHGFECFCEILGTSSKMIINGNPAKSRVEIRDQHGVRMESHQSWLDRLAEAFLLEIQDFTACVLDDTKIPATARDGLEAAKIAMALTHSLHTGKVVEFDEEGEPIIV